MPRIVLLVLAGLMIVALAGGIAWFSVHHASPTAGIDASPTVSIHQASPAGSITEFPVPPGSNGPNEITAGPDGNLWFTESAGNKIGRITSGK